MAKEVDINGFWLIEANPVTKEGVFPYTGSQIDFSGSLGLEPNKIYNVYRPASELFKEETLKSFNGVPFIEEHEMIGDGCTDYDNRPAGGILFNPTAEPQSGTVLGNFRIFSESLKDSIEQGKKELSLGYRCCYEFLRGIFKGQPYDFVQKDIVGNHVALVDKGRMGSSVRVYDHNTMVFDSMEAIKPITKGTDAMTEEEKAKKEAEEAAAAKKAQDEATEAEAQKAKDEAAEAEKKAQDEAEAAKKDEEQKAADAAEAEKAKEEEEKAKGSAQDSAIKAAVIMLSERDALVKQVQPLIGTFDHAVMTSADEVADYACKKLKLPAGKGESKAMIKGFLAGRSGTGSSFVMDAAPKSGKDAALDKYLKGE